MASKEEESSCISFFHGWNNKFVKKVNTNFYWFFKKTFAKADCFIVLASEFKNQLRQWGIKVPIYLLTTAVSNNLLKGFNIDKKLEKIKQIDTRKILFLARIEKEKGIFETIDAFKILLDKNFKVKVSIAGDGSCLEKVKNYVTSLHVEKHVNFLGYVIGEKSRDFYFA